MFRLKNAAILEICLVSTAVCLAVILHIIQSFICLSEGNRTLSMFWFFSSFVSSSLREGSKSYTLLTVTPPPQRSQINPIFCLPTWSSSLWNLASNNFKSNLHWGTRRFYYAAGVASEPDEANRGPHLTPTLFPKSEFLSSNYLWDNKPYIDRACLVKKAGFWPRSFVCFQKPLSSLGP